MNKILLQVLIAFLIVTGCSDSKPGVAPVSDNYHEQIVEWKQNRIDRLKEPTGWLRLAGMFLLEEGENTFGSGEEADIQFPAGTIPEIAGTFILEDGIVKMISAEGVNIHHHGTPVSEFVLDDGNETPAVEYGNLEWLVITRADLKAIRLYNKDNVKADSFEGFPSYPVGPEWHRQARFIRNDEGATIPIVNVLGQHEDASSPGVLEFTIDGILYSLDALEGGERLFIIFADESNRTETYQAGRYMYIDYPEPGSEFTVIDFNKAYNPPCAYNIFTTCQLPPSQNRLKVSITAGEKRPVEWTGLQISE
jgi:uncharacterized protein